MEITFRNQFEQIEGRRKKSGVVFSADTVCGSCFYSIEELLLLGDQDLNAGIARIIVELAHSSFEDVYRPFHETLTSKSGLR